MCVKKLLLAFVVLGLLAGCKIDPGRGLDAVMTLYKGETLSDKDAADIGKQAVSAEDSRNKIVPASDAYAKRLARLTDPLKKEGGLSLDFKAYRTDEVNAFATADGSIRVYTGLMDLMGDDELFFVIGHEIGHVKNGDTKAAFKNAYRVSAARKALGAAHEATAALSDSQLGNIMEVFLNAQYSQSQESNADKYGASLMKEYGKKKAAAVSALRKLQGKGGAFSSHPGSQERAAAIEKMADW